MPKYSLFVLDATKESKVGEMDLIFNDFKAVESVTGVNVKLFDAQNAVLFERSFVKSDFVDTKLPLLQSYNELPKEVSKIVVQITKKLICLF